MTTDWNPEKFTYPVWMIGNEMGMEPGVFRSFRRAKKEMWDRLEGTGPDYQPGWWIYRGTATVDLDSLEVDDRKD